MTALFHFFPLKILLLLFLACTSDLFIHGVYAQKIILTPISTSKSPTHNTLVENATSAQLFQSTAFPVQNTRTIKIIFKDPSGRGAAILLKDSAGHRIYGLNCLKTKMYIGKLDLSLLPDGDYMLEVIALTKAGFTKHKYTYSFKLESQTERTIKPWNKEVEKELYTRRFEQVHR